MNSIERAMEHVSKAKNKTLPNIDFANRETSEPTAKRSAIDQQATNLEPVKNRKVVHSDQTAPKSPVKILKIPEQQFKSNGLITPDQPRSRIAEEYRLIKRPLLSNIDNKDIPAANIIMITSSLEGEGKTWTSANLAMSIAMERDKTVLLVDTDAAKGTASNLFGVEAGHPGLIDVLTGEVENLGDVMLQTNIPNLRVMPVGENHDHATELLASKNMRHVVDELSERYADRVVIFDSPPILPTAEAKVLATLVGQIVFVVEAEKTSQAIVAEALTYLNKEQEVGLVLNRSKKNSSSGYGYGYGFEHGTGNRQRSNQRASSRG